MIIYRDGVGEHMRQQVLEVEVAQFTKVCRGMFGEKGPEITVIVVNKRIS